MIDIKINLVERAKNDLKFIIECLNSGNFSGNNNFSKKLNRDLKTIIEKDKNSDPPTITVIRIHQWYEPKIKKSPFYFLNKTINVNVKIIGDHYYLINGEKSGIPGSIEKEALLETGPLEYFLRYKEKNGDVILKSFNDEGDGYRLGL